METQKSSNGSAEETPKQESNSKQLIEQHVLSGTPFTVIKVDEHWFLAIGKYRLTNQLNTRAEAEAEVHDTSWIRIMQIMKIVCLEHDAEKQLEKTIDRQIIEAATKKSPELQRTPTEQFKRMTELAKERQKDREKFETQNTDGSHITTEFNEKTTD